MHASSRSDSHLPPRFGSTTVRADVGTDTTAQPPLTSGFGSVMEREQEIKSATEDYLGGDNGTNSAAIDRVLGHQRMRLNANIALLEQRYEMLPKPARFATLHTAPRPLSQSHIAAAPAILGTLACLVAQHVDLLKAIKALIAHCPDGQRGDLILAEIARNHEEMTTALTALIEKDDTVRDAIALPVIASLLTAEKPEPSETNWENEGGGPNGH